MFTTINSICSECRSYFESKDDRLIYVSEFVKYSTTNDHLKDELASEGNVKCSDASVFLWSLSVCLSKSP